MALPLLSPALERTRQVVAAKSSKAFLQLVPEIESGERAGAKSLTIVGTAIGVFVLVIYFILNSISTSDAFLLGKLQVENQQLVSQRDEVNRKISEVSTPEALANQAKKLGMKEATSISYLELNNG